jgi:hypothetical protein
MTFAIANSTHNTALTIRRLTIFNTAASLGGGRSANLYENSKTISFCFMPVIEL